MNSVKTIGWGLYLACSWTWCIGMFLPLILIDRYGWAGFFMFAVPNVIGCSAFGYVLRSPERSRAMVKKYRGALASFAVITIAFHAFFLAIVARYLIPDIPAWWAIVLPSLVLLAGVLISFLPHKLWPILGTIVWFTSIGIGILFWPGSLHLETTPTHPWQEVIWLLPITSFGFFLCPYLDPTFHRALQSSPSKHSFGVFGFAFALMIVLTCMYRDAMIVGLATILLVHIISQSVFTVGAHIREGWLCEVKSRRGIFAIGIIIACAVVILIAHRSHQNIREMTDDYLRFFVFYGLVFPGLVASFVWTKKRFTLLRSALFALVAIVSLPLLEAGYIGGSAWLSVLPVVVFATWVFADQN
ncbi:MAG: hypothetical protein QF444_01630 [Phycisphaerales bacterium]|nr:hypothetical protein [Phycisphaerales bacterium]